MAVNYSSLLTDEQKKSILEQRLAQFASEAYQHDINKQVAGGGGSGVPYDLRTDTTNYPTRHGLANTGGGGGGVSAGRAGAAGGSGIVIIRYSTSYDDPTSYTGTKYVSGAYKYFKFTATGSITF